MYSSIISELNKYKKKALPLQEHRELILELQKHRELILGKIKQIAIIYGNNSVPTYGDKTVKDFEDYSLDIEVINELIRFTRQLRREYAVNGSIEA